MMMMMMMIYILIAIVISDDNQYYVLVVVVIFSGLIDQEGYGFRKYNKSKNTHLQQMKDYYKI
jgi:hypothetical protein